MLTVHTFGDKAQYINITNVDRSRPVQPAIVGCFSAANQVDASNYLKSTLVRKRR